MIRLSFYTTLVLLNLSYLSAQCGITVDAGPDLLVCGRQIPIQLQGSVSAETFGFEWFADPTLLKEETLNPDAYPRATTTYTLVGYVADPEDNLVVNPGFEDGDTGFFTEYVYGPGPPDSPLNADGTYVIGDVNQATLPQFTQCDDRSGGGNSMSCNGSEDPNLKVWCQTVAITPNETYVLRAWITAIWDIGAAQLQFSVNGDLVGPVFFPDIDAVCTWQLFDERWASTDGETSAEICVVNQTTEFFGFNFGIDDLFFAPVCEQYDEVTVTVVDTLLDLRSEYVLPCNPPAAGYLLTTGTTTTGPNYSHRWTTADGNIVSGANSLAVRIDQVGTYTLEMIYDDGVNTCTNSRTVRVVPSPLTPQVDIQSDGDLNCNRPLVTISAATSTAPAGSRFFWSTLDGTIVNRDDEEIEVNQTGTYRLTILSPAGCSAEGEFVVAEDFTTPMAQVSGSAELTCEVTSVVLDASSTALGPDDSFVWTTTDGAFTGDVNTLMPTATQAGRYVFTVMNNLTGCTSSAFVTVTGTTDPTIATVAPPPAINCQGTPVELNGVGSTTRAGVTYEWLTDIGTFAGPTDGIRVLVSAPGTYLLEVTEANGCTDIATVEVVREGFNPPISFQPPELITCDRARINLSAEVPAMVPVDYAWTTSDGNVVSGANTLTPEIDAPGNYLLTVTERENGCTVAASISVSADNAPPTVIAASTGMLDCSTGQVQLLSDGSSSGSEFDFSWTDEEGNPVTTDIRDAGTYQLQITNRDNGCSASDQVTIAIDTLRPTIDLSTPDTELTCLRERIDIGETTTEANVSYSWSGPAGGIEGAEDIPQITATLAGTYSLLALNTANGCSSTGEVVLTSTQEKPIFSIEDPILLTCDQTRQSLEATITNPDGFEISWTGTGNIVSGAQSLTPEIDAPGTYQVVFSNPASGCADSSSIVVGQDIVSPTASIAPTMPLTCQVPSLQLDASGSSSGANFFYEWSTSDGTIIDDSDLRDVRVTAAGTYRIRVTDTNNGCTDESDVVVVEDGDRPEIDMALTQVLTCVETSRVLNEGTTTDPSLTYSWQSPDGDLPPVTDQADLEISSPGSYTLTVRDPGNGCETTATVSVSEDVNRPIVNIAPPAELNCTNMSLPLDGSGSVVVAPAQTRWTTSDGSIATGDQLLSSIVDAPGEYTLVITYTDNGCVDSASVSVAIDTTAPLVVIPPADILNCRTTTLDLATTGQGSGNFDYQWATTDGVIDSDETLPEIMVSTPGTYRIVVVNTDNTCSRSTEVMVTQDIAAPVLEPISPYTLNCRNTSITEVVTVQTGRPVNDFLWSTADGEISGLNTNRDLSVEVPGTYVVLVTDPVNGCSATGTWIVDEDIERPNLSLPSEIDLGCDFGPSPITAVVDEGEEFVYQWSQQNLGEIISGFNTPTAIVAGPGAFNFLVGNTRNGCESTATVVARQTLLDSFAVAFFPPDCNQETGTVNFGEVSGGVGPFIYSLDGGENYSAETMYPDLEPGNYDLRVQDSRGCEAVEELIVLPARTLELGLPERFDLLKGDSVLLNLESNFLPQEIDTIIWSPSLGLSCVDCPNPYARPFETTSYTVEVLTFDGCVARRQVNLLVDERIGVYFPTAFSPNGDGVNELFLPMGDDERVRMVRSLMIVDRWGNAVYQGNDLPIGSLSEGWDGTMRDKPMNAGVFAWAASVELFDGTLLQFSGEVMLIR